MTAKVKVEIYTRRSCPYCDVAKRFLQAKGVDYEEISLDEQPHRLEEMFKRCDNRRTVPQILINGESIGGCDDLLALDKRGELEARLEKDKH